jgi:hypothetical protein
MYPIAYEWGRVGRIGAYTAAILALSVWVVPNTGALGIAARLALMAAYPLGLVAIGAVSRADLRRIPGALRAARRRRGGQLLDDADVTP